MNPFYDFFQRNHALAKIEQALRSKSATLTLEDFDLVQIPESLLNCQELHTLFLARNKLYKLPGLNKLRNLHTLAIDYNNLDHFPAALKELPHLRSLNISHNPIKCLSADIGCLLELESLWCNSCCLTSLPEEIELLIRLDTLGARNNLLTELPQGICKLKSLRWLTLENNKLTLLPNSFGNLSSLLHLNLNKNQFNCIPKQLTRIKKLRYLLMQHNDMFTLNHQVLHKMGHVHKINLMHNPIIVSRDSAKKYSNIVMPGSDWVAPNDMEEESNSDESSENWEDSVDSSELGIGTTDSETDDEEILSEYLPQISKYLVTY